MRLNAQFRQRYIQGGYYKWHTGHCSIVLKQSININGETVKVADTVADSLRSVGSRSCTASLLSIDPHVTPLNNGANVVFNQYVVRGLEVVISNKTTVGKMQCDDTSSQIGNLQCIQGIMQYGFEHLKISNYESAVNARGVHLGVTLGGAMVGISLLVCCCFWMENIFLKKNAQRHDAAKQRASENTYLLKDIKSNKVRKLDEAGDDLEVGIDVEDFEHDVHATAKRSPDAAPAGLRQQLVSLLPRVRPC